MAIESNIPGGTAEGVTNTGKPEGPAERPGGFAGASFSSKPLEGSGDYLGLSKLFGINRIDPTVKPYLDDVLKTLKEKLSNIELITLDRLQDAYAIRYDGPDGYITLFGIQFVPSGDPIMQDFVPQSWRLTPMVKELRERFSDRQYRIVDTHLILSGYAPEMERTEQMAQTIFRAFVAATDPEARAATISYLNTTEFVADWNLSEAKRAESMLSAHGIRPRMDIGLTIKAKIPNPYGREMRGVEATYRTVAVIGGYIEMGDIESMIVGGQQLRRYRPVFNITVLNSELPFAGVGAIALAAIAPTIYKTMFWLHQYSNLSEGQPQPGLLEMDKENPGRPYILKTKEDLTQFASEMMFEPAIAVRFQDGKDGIPGFWRVGSGLMDQQAAVFDELARFFESPGEQLGQLIMGRVRDIRIEGGVGDANGILHDSRDVDYLTVAAKNGVNDPEVRRILLRGTEIPAERARLIQSLNNNFIPLYRDSVMIVNPTFVDWILQKTMQHRLVIVDPNHHNEVRPLGSILDGFGSTANMGTIIQSTPVNRGFQMGSVYDAF